MHVWTFDETKQGIVEEYPIGTTQTKVAVIDSGVQRDHPDLWWIFTEYGTDCFNNVYISGQHYGWYRESDQYRNHGTNVAGIIAAHTNNSFPDPPHYNGVASCSPGIRVVPIYIPFTKGNAVEKAVRALRFDYYLTGPPDPETGRPFATSVRVASMSLGAEYPDQKIADYDIGRDVLVEHRFYVAAAGNYGQYGKYYPAAKDVVLGVTGMDGEVDGNDLTETFEQHPSTNYYTCAEPQVYGVSAFFEFSFIPWGGCDDDAMESLWSTWISSNYGGFGGTSAATPQVAALAARLYEEKP